MRYLIIIPARKGSKRLKGKNLRPMNGKPLITHTVEAAQGCGLNATLCVSSDSSKVLQTASRHGVDVPLARPEHLSDDFARSSDVILHAILACRSRGLSFDAVMLLQPTSPLRTAAHIREAALLFEQRSATTVVSVCALDHSPSWTMRLDDSCSLDDFSGGVGWSKEPITGGSYFQLNGAIYISRLDAFLKHESFFPGYGSFAYVMSRECSVDIDDLVDFRLAEMLMRERGMG
jgi:CMP-N,N'-diacetyllegionaminic acid synthase